MWLMDRLVTLEGGRHEARMQSEVVINGALQKATAMSACLDGVRSS